MRKWVAAAALIVTTTEALACYSTATVFKSFRRKVIAARYR